ncbi:hypothetical protein EJ04DRAFT_538910 [Polyplosphaeria fusca]|uniref:NB-ARC domain-containing protein n=1 Tax=Polyplosphaeria fusca TaxID=682080 RepID=A0A9P4QKS3_9PLEO|nr:hypothetical protein EJ04DRAFT_538910 [Polyplosphaeria fusca]
MATTFERSTNFGLQVGGNYGRIEAHFHPAAERPETPSSPSCALPFRRDPDFVDRGTLLDRIREKSSAPASRIALVGLGGVGKSQLAIEHCYRTAERSAETWVFWVHASNAARLEQGFRDIANLVKLAGRKDPQADVFKLVHDWLRDARKGRWLLVLDNADDAAVLSPVSRSLPPSRHGAVIVTSRTERATSCLVEDGDVFHIKPMQKGDAQALLHRKLGDKVEKSGTMELVTALERIPLALVQAAAYIRERAPRCSVRQYLDEFRRNDERKTSLLDYEAGSLRRDEEAKNSIIITWQISFDHIRDVRESAANLLSLMSFFDRQGIPETLLHGYEQRHVGSSGLGSSDESRESVQDGAASEVSKRALEEDILMLRKYSFIASTTSGDAFEMHSLVQLATRRWLGSQDQLERWKQQYITNLCASFPPGRYENWARCQALFPHVTAVVEHRPESNEYLQKWALLLYNAAWFAWQRGSAGEAEMMCVLSMEVRKGLFSEEHMETLDSMAMVGLVKKMKGWWKEAEELEVRVMETSSRRVLGDEHPSTLTSMNNLAFTLQSQGLYSKAIPLLEECCRLRQHVLGPDHPHTRSSLEALQEWKAGKKAPREVCQSRSLWRSMIRRLNI